MTEVKLRVKGGKVVGSVLGPVLGPLGVDSKAVAAKINAITHEFGGKKVPVTLVIEDKQWSVRLEQLTDSFRLRQMQHAGLVDREALEAYAKQTIDKTRSKTLVARCGQLQGILKSLNAA